MCVAPSTSVTSSLDILRDAYYAVFVVIRSWNDKETKALWSGERSRKFQGIEKRARVRLSYLNAAAQLMDLSLPGYRLEKLAGDRKGQYSIRINDQYRICFEWRKGDVYSVEVTDYH